MSIEDVSEIDVEFGIKDQQEDGQYDGGPYPDNLFPESLGKVKYTSICFHDIGRIDIHPAK